MSEMVQSIKLKIVCNEKNSILFLVQHNFIVSRLVVYKKAFDVRRQGAYFSTKHRVFVYFTLFLHINEFFEFYER